MEKLPDEILVHIFSFLELEDLLRVALVDTRCFRAHLDSHIWFSIASSAFQAYPVRWVRPRSPNRAGGQVDQLQDHLRVQAPDQTPLARVGPPSLTSQLQL